MIIRTARAVSVGPVSAGPVSGVWVSAVWGSVILIAGLAAVSLGCKAQPEADALKKKGPAIKVNLPPSPEMVEPKVVEKFVDGSYTVSGLIKNRGKLLRSGVRVRGFVQSVYRCDPAAGHCELPDHAVLVDDLKHPRKRLLVTGGDQTHFVSLQQGEEATLEGLYTQSDHGAQFIRMEGLLVLPVLPEDQRPAPQAPPDEAEPAPAPTDKAAGNAPADNGGNAPADAPTSPQ